MESRAAVVHTPSHDFLEDRPAEIETIEVRESRDEEVLVEIAAASLCHTDISSAGGNRNDPIPFVMGHEGAGIVRDVGENVTSVEPGDHVVLGRIACGQCERCRMGRSNHCLVRRSSKGTLRTGDRAFAGQDGSPYYHYHGVSAFTEYTMVTEDVAIPITDEVPLEQAPLLGCGVFTGFGAVTNTANIETGASVAIFGAGGVGLSGVQGAAVRGATDIIVVDVVPEKFDIAKNLGATEVIDASTVDPVKRIHEVTGDGVEYAFDMVGNPRVVEQTLDAVAPMGTAVITGTPPERLNTVELDFSNIVVSEKRMIGAFNGSYNLPVAIPMLAEMVASGKLSLTEMITNTRPLDEVNEAMAALESGSGEIRQVLLP